MAAPDFPASPTVGQTYTAPSGLVYTWDGQVWNTSGGVASTYWTDTGTQLQPTTGTRNLAVTGDPATPSGLILGSNAIKTRLQMPNNQGATVGGFRLNVNYDWRGGAQDDTTKPSWIAEMKTDTDAFKFIRQAPAGAFTTLLTVDNAGHVFSKAMASNINNNSVQQAISLNTWTPVNMTTQGSDSAGGTMSTPASSQLKSTASGWSILNGFCQFSANLTNMYLSIEYFASGSWYTLGYGTGANTAFVSQTAVAVAGGVTQYRMSVYCAAAATILWATFSIVQVGNYQ